MKTRVTITLDPEVHRLAIQTARQRKTTVSGLIASLVQAESHAQKRGIVAGMIGSASLREPAPGADPLFETLSRKYLRE